MSVHDAQPGDIYVDEGGNLWRVTGVYQDPTVEMERFEPRGYVGASTRHETGQPPQGSFIRERVFGGVRGLMWRGFKRIRRGEWE